jgi:hypothetical protein
MADRRNLCDNDFESAVICDTDPDEYAEDTQSIELEDVTMKNNHYCQYNENRLQNRDCGLRLTRCVLRFIRQ